MPAPRPFVTANFAITADARISTRNLTPSDFSSPRDKRRLLEIRARNDAVMVGARTLAADTMTLGLPAEDLRDARKKQGRPELPLRVILTNGGRLDPALKILQAQGAPVVIFSTMSMPIPMRSKLARRADVFLHSSRTVNLPVALATLREDYGIKSVVCEGGGTLFRSLLASALVDELCLTFCPRIFGGHTAPTLTGIAAGFLPRSTHLRLLEMLPAGDECFTRWRVIHSNARLVM